VQALKQLERERQGKAPKKERGGDPARHPRRALRSRVSTAARGRGLAAPWTRVRCLIARACCAVDGKDAGKGKKDADQPPRPKLVALVQCAVTLNPEPEPEPVAD
jgi:hypothetical protein